MKRVLIAAVALMAIFVLFGFAVQKTEACHAEGGADCEGWWLNLVGPGDGWVLDHVVGETSGTWQPGQTHVDYDVTSTWKRWVSQGNWAYADPICPIGYHVQNSGNWNQRCHRDHNWQHPEHKAPIGCPADFSQSGADCRRWVDTSHWIYETYRFFGAINRPDCYIPCSETVVQTPTVLWGDWSPWIYNSESELEESYRDGLETTVYLDSQNPQLVCETRTRPVHEERTREVEYPSGDLLPSQLCEPAPGNWNYEVVVPEGASYELAKGSLTGSWLNQYAPENNSAFVPTVVFSWASGYSESVVGEVITKSSACVHCRVSIAYPQTTYFNPTAPGVYWQGPFDTAACPIVHRDGEVPSPDRVATICSLCPESGYESGFIYSRTDSEAKFGYVERYECYGQPTHYYYLGYLWDEWYKPNFDSEGNRLDCRVQGCADWIHDNLPNQ